MKWSRSAAGQIGHVGAEGLAGDLDAFGHGQVGAPQVRDLADRHPGGDDVDRGGGDLTGVLRHGGDPMDPTGLGVRDDLGGVSSRNGINNTADSSGHCTSESFDHLIWSGISIPFPRPPVNLSRHHVEVLLGVLAQLGAHGKILPQESIHVLVTAALPGRVGFTKIDW